MEEYMKEKCVYCNEDIDLEKDEHVPDAESIGDYWCVLCAKAETVRMLDEQIALKTIINKALHAFPKSFINHNNEIILNPKWNTYFILEGVDSELLFKCKMFEWLSRPIHKGLPTKAAHKMLDNFNYLLGTRFTRDDMELIYAELGNSTNHELTIEFVKSEYDMSLLKRVVDG